MGRSQALSLSMALAHLSGYAKAVGIFVGHTLWQEIDKILFWNLELRIPDISKLLYAYFLRIMRIFLFTQKIRT
jgi:hypothetical protein